MPKKRKQGAKPTGGTLDAETKIKSVMGKRAVVIGSKVKGPVTGNQTIRTKIDTLVSDEDALLIGAEIDGHTSKKS